MITRAFSMARVLRLSVSTAALALLMTAAPAFAQENCGAKCGGGDGPSRDSRDFSRDNQRDPLIEETIVAEELILVPPPVFNLPASNAPVTRESSGQIRSSWAVGVFR